MSVRTLGDLALVPLLGSSLFMVAAVSRAGRYSFQVTQLPGGPRPLREPDAADYEQART
ncbi:hypothetical protein ACWCQQ_42245 [Streptomyces sp. NPDC002143]